jgi:hypothetical protein
MKIKTIFIGHALLAKPRSRTGNRATQVFYQELIEVSAKK